MRRQLAGYAAFQPRPPEYKIEVVVCTRHFRPSTHGGMGKQGLVACCISMYKNMHE